MAAICHGQLYQSRMKIAFDHKVRPRCFQVGDLVLKRILPPQTDHRGKWTPNYDGPYIVTKVFNGGALMLATMDGEDFTSPVNSDANRYTRGISLKSPADVCGGFSSTVGVWYLIPAKLVRALDSSIPSRFSPLYFPKHLFQKQLLLRVRCQIVDLDARPMVSFLEVESWYRINFASPVESSLSQIMVARNTIAFLSSKLSVPFSPQSESRYFVIARTPCGGSFPHRVRYDVYLQQHCLDPEDCGHFPSRIPCLGLAFFLT
ncbi:hypothetical protein KIW84_022826 [Lathyrus oleraceus]|uniref:Uncharacterized protein n=1 Tax=Pisum sativum TaxID=3888 RepID=A0A9D5BB59_PEA|nr:hypothetical protein KIW84_022826 [Pisum sativum]